MCGKSSKCMYGIHASSTYFTPPKAYSEYVLVLDVVVCVVCVKVRQLMSEMRTMHTEEHFMQITRTSDTLMRKLFFCPGYSVSNV